LRDTSFPIQFGPDDSRMSERDFPIAQPTKSETAATVRAAPHTNDEVMMDEFMDDENMDDARYERWAARKSERAKEAEQDRLAKVKEIRAQPAVKKAEQAEKAAVKKAERAKKAAVKKAERTEQLAAKKAERAEKADQDRLAKAEEIRAKETLRFETFERALATLDEAGRNRFNDIDNFISHLHTCISEGNIIGVEFWLKYVRDEDINGKYSLINIYGLMMAAACAGNPDIFEIVYKRFRVYTREDSLKNLLCMAAKYGYVRTMEKIAFYMSNNEIDEIAERVINEAMMYNKINVLTFLKKEGVNFRSRKTIGISTLCGRPSFFKLPVQFFKALNDLGIEFKNLDANFCTELVRANNTAAFEWMLNENFFDTALAGRTFILEAATDRTIDVFKILTSGRIDPRYDDDLVSRFAVSCGWNKVLFHLLHDLKLEYSAETKSKLLRIAIINGRVETVSLLLANGFKLIADGSDQQGDLDSDPWDDFE
jgi:hypothetical protein